MTETIEERKTLLLTIAKKFLDLQNNSPHVLNLLEETAVWDETECDGCCLLEEITEILEQEKREKKDDS
jgi:hypothetical protein